MRDYTATVASIEAVTPTVRRVILATDRPVSFKPGQYVLLRTPDGDERPYSIASTPADPQRIELHIKLSAGGKCTEGWVFKDLRVGDPVAFSGPYGRFSFRPLRDEPVLLLASGTGLAPMKAIIRHIWESGSEHEVVLYHGVATVEELYDREWFEDLEAEVDWFSYQPAVSREEYGGRSGRVPALLAEDYPKAGGNVAYICGSPDMVADTMKARLFPRNIYREDFFDSADRANGTHVVRSPLIKR